MHVSINIFLLLLGYPMAEYGYTGISELPVIFHSVETTKECSKINLINPSGLALSHGSEELQKE